MNDRRPDREKEIPALKRLFVVMLAVIAVLSVTVCAAAAPRYREKPGGSVADYADILSKDTVSELTQFHDLLMEKAGVDLMAASVLFFDGKEPAVYTKELFEAWGLGDMSFLIVMAPGEDSFYTMAGSGLIRSLPEESQQHLLTAYFQDSFVNQRYDEAVARYMPALANLLSKQLGAAIPMGGLFGQSSQPVPASPPPQAPSDESAGEPAGEGSLLPSNFWDRWESGLEEAEEKVSHNVIVREEKRSGISLGKIFLLILIFYFIFGGRKRSYYKKGCGCMGCGPIGWLLAALGVREAFKDD